MNPIESFEVGIAPEHLPALLAAMALPLLVWSFRRMRIRPGQPMNAPTPRPVARRWAAWLLGIAAVVHLALPLGHLDEVVLSMSFVGSGVAYGWLALRVLEGKSWRRYSAPLLVATLIAYCVAVTAGGEEP